eukprot:gene28383-31518_t
MPSFIKSSYISPMSVRVPNRYLPSTPSLRPASSSDIDRVDRVQGGSKPKLATGGHQHTTAEVDHHGGLQTLSNPMAHIPYAISSAESSDEEGGVGLAPTVELEASMMFDREHQHAKQQRQQRRHGSHQQLPANVTAATSRHHSGHQQTPKANQRPTSSQQRPTADSTPTDIHGATTYN